VNVIKRIFLTLVAVLALMAGSATAAPAQADAYLQVNNAIEALYGHAPYYGDNDVWAKWRALEADRGVDIVSSQPVYSAFVHLSDNVVWGPIRFYRACFSKPSCPQDSRGDNTGWYNRAFKSELHSYGLIDYPVIPN
jgi:hypothetical protein